MRKAHAQKGADRDGYKLRARKSLLAVAQPDPQSVDYRERRKVDLDKNCGKQSCRSGREYVPARLARRRPEETLADSAWAF